MAKNKDEDVDTKASKKKAKDVDVKASKKAKEPEGKKKAKDADDEPRGRKKGKLRLKIEDALKTGVKANKKSGVVLSEMATEFNTTSLTVLRIAEAMELTVRKVDGKNVAFAG